MATISTTRASYAHPHVRIGHRPKPVISLNDRDTVAQASNNLSKVLTATTDSALDYNLTEAYRLIRKALLARKSC